MFFPDYLFYKFALWFLKSDGEGGSRAGIAVSALYMAVLWTVGIYIIYRLEGSIWINEHLKYIVICACTIWCVIVYANYRRYRNKFRDLDIRWRNDSILTSIIKAAFAMTTYFLILFLSIKITHELPF